MMIPCKRFCLHLFFSETWTKCTLTSFVAVFTYLRVKWDSSQAPLKRVKVKAKELLWNDDYITVHAQRYLLYSVYALTTWDNSPKLSAALSHSFSAFSLQRKRDISGVGSKQLLLLLGADFDFKFSFLATWNEILPPELMRAHSWSLPRSFLRCQPPPPGWAFTRPLFRYNFL